MERTPRTRKDRTGLVVSAIFHVLLIGALAYWAHTTGQLEKLKQALRVYTSEKKKEPKKEPPKPVQPKVEPSRLPPPNSNPSPRANAGTRRAPAANAPGTVGESFFQDTRTPVQGAASGGPGGPAKGPPPKLTAPSAPPPPRRPAFGPAPRSTVKQLLAERAQAAAATEAFGAEQISKTGVSDAGAIINKVSGASVVDGKFAVIRGLSDRYVSTTLNGGEIPSADPYRRSASLDLFPAQIINKVIVSKTSTPDQPGTYTGGGIDIITKSFPEKSFVSLSLGGSYNTQASLNGNFLSYPGGSLDWAGTDDGTRSLPDSLSPPDLMVPNPPFNSGLPASPTYSQRVADAEKLNSLTKDMGLTEFSPTHKSAPLNHNFSVAAGDTTHLFGKPLGAFAGLSYRRDFSLYTGGVSRRYAPGGAPGEFVVRSDYVDSKAIEVVNWAGMVNLAYELHPDHEIAFNFLYNQNAEDLARQQAGTRQDDPGAQFHLNRLHFTERNLNTFQLKGTHHLPELAGVKLDWLAVLSQTTQQEPNTRFFNFAEDGGNFEVGKSSVPDPKNPTRYFRDLDESNRNLKADLTIPFRQWSWQEGEFKLGVFDSVSDRIFTDREVYYQGEAAFNGDPNTYLTDGNLGYSATTNASNGRINYTWNRYIQNRDSAYVASSGIRAGYLMLDFPVIENLRLIGGMRLELTDLSVHSRSYLANSVTGKSTNSSSLNQADWLPAAGVVYSLRTNMNLRASYSQTIARPSFRELAGYRSYDPVLEDLLDGNPNLKMSQIENYDLRWEWFTRPGELLSVSLFYKKLKNAIERRYVTTDAEIISFANRETASVLGVEFEVRKNLDFIHPLLHDFTLGANLSLIQSEVALTPEELYAKQAVLGHVDPTRPLYDQSPYIFNADLSYDLPHSGTSATLVFNVAGPRITIASLNSEDVYEQPVPGLDFILSQRINPRMALKFSAKNLLDPQIERTYGKSSPLLYSSYKRGMTFGISFNYDF